MLRRAALLEMFDDRPHEAIAALRDQAIGTGMHWPDLYALAELNYYEDRRTKSKAMLLASALYAYAVLFPAGAADQPSPYNTQFRQAADLYNLALTQVLSGTGAEGVANLQSGPYDLPFGALDVTVDQASLTFAGRAMTSFVPTMNLEARGFQNDYRNDGLGAPLAAGLVPSPHPDIGLVLPASAGSGAGMDADTLMFVCASESRTKPSRSKSSSILGPLSRNASALAGSGAGGFAAALTANHQGLDVIMVEKEPLFGGTTAYSAGVIWIPVNSHQKDAGISDSREDALTYLAHHAGTSQELRLMRESTLGLLQVGSCRWEPSF